MPVATVGALSVLDRAGIEARAVWTGARTAERLHIDAPVEADAMAELLVTADWPALDKVPWPDGRYTQGLKPTLGGRDSPTETFRMLVTQSPPVEATLLRTILTDAVLDNDGIPARNRLLRGVKADLSSIANRPRRIDAGELAAELRHGPAFRKGESGLGLGLVPEVQTFGGTTGPEASTVGAYSPLLYLLLWHGLLALPPVGVVRGHRRVVGGPMVTTAESLSWPRWSVPVGLRSLRTLLSLRAIHADVPSRAELSPRGIDAVYRACAVPLSTMVAVFRWGEQVMR